MPPETPAPACAPSRPAPLRWSRRWRPLRAVWPYVLIAVALLAASEVLWLWYSWPVRQVLESEQPSAGASI